MASSLEVEEAVVDAADVVAVVVRPGVKEEVAMSNGNDWQDLLAEMKYFLHYWGRATR